MKIKVKISAAFDRYTTVSENEIECLSFEEPVPVKTVLRKLMIPEELSMLILINGIVKNKEQLLRDGDTLSIFPTMSGG